MDQAPTSKRKASAPPRTLPLPPGSAADGQPARTPHTRPASGPKRKPSPAPRPVAEPATPEAEFIQAMQAYKVQSGRMFPTWSEVLEVLKALGYEKADTATPADDSAVPHARTA